MKTYSVRELSAVHESFDFSIFLGTQWTGTLVDFLQVSTIFDIIKIKVATHFIDDENNRLFAVWCARKAIASIGFYQSSLSDALNIAESYAKGSASQQEVIDAWDGVKFSLHMNVNAYDTVQAAFDFSRPANESAFSASSNLMLTYNSSKKGQSLSRQEQVDFLVKLIKSGGTAGACEITGNNHIPVNVGFNQIIWACKNCGVDVQPHV